MRYRSSVAAIALVLAFTIPAVAADDVAITPDVVYGHKDGMALTYDVFKPADSNGAGVIFMVSGGWFSRWRPPEQAAAFFENLTGAGYTVYAVRHGSAPKYKVPEAFKDVKEAVKHIKANADDFGVNANRLGVMGMSAGGHLSLMLGTTGQPSGGNGAGQASDVAAVVAYFPPVDLRRIVGPNERFPALDFAQEDAESVSPLLHVSADDPPTLLIHGDQDDLVPVSASEIMYEELQEKEVTSKLIIIEGASHGFRGEHGERAIKASVEWFEKYLNQN